MSTHSAIIRQTEAGTFEGIYCHFDGYPEGVGATLYKHYKDPDKVKRLIELGALSSLGERLNPIGPHSFNKPEDDTTVAYHRDRGDDLRVITGKTAKAVRERIDYGDFVYLFKNREWRLNDKPLKARLKL